MALSRKMLPMGFAVIATLSFSSLKAPLTFANVDTPPKVSLQQAEQIAVTTFSIPKSYTLQNESYNSNNGSTEPALYYLNYRDSDPSSGGQWLTVTVDANTGTILNYNRPSSDNQFLFPVPVSPQKAQQIADQWAEKLYPSQFPNVKALPLTPSSGSLTGPTQYTYNYERVMSGVPAPFDGFSITIDQNGNLVSLNDHWSNLPFPSVTQATSTTEANAVYRQALDLHLEYQSVYHTDSQPTTELTYQAAPQNYPNYWGGQFSGTDSIEFPVINAQTGKITASTGSEYQPETYQNPTPLVPGGPKLAQSRPPVNWTQEQSQAYAEKMVGITSKDTLQSVNQYKNPDSDTTWNFNWQTADKTSIQVTVDATRGFISNYSAYQAQTQSAGSAKGSQDSNSKPKFTQAQIDNTVRNFVKQLFPDNTGAIAVTPQAYASKDPSTGLSTSYQIVYLVGGIPDQTRSGSISVNPQTGKVQNMWMNSQQADTSLPDKAAAISVNQAVADWMKARPLTLEYLETQPQMAGKMPSTGNGKSTADQSPRVILAYAPTADQTASGQFNAQTGQFENSGVQTPYSGTIQDISGNPAQAELQLLVDRELVNVDNNGDVHPNQTMTHSAFLKLLVDSLGYQTRYNTQLLASTAAKSALANVPADSPAYHEIGAAYSMGWIPSDESFDPNALTTRDYAAQILARALGFTPLLAHPDAFKFPASDAGTIAGTHQAGDALAVTLHLMSLQDGAFKPNVDVTLSDTAIAVVQAAVIEGEQGQPYPPRPIPLGR